MEGLLQRMEVLAFAKLKKEDRESGSVLGSPVRLEFGVTMKIRIVHN